MLIVERKSQWVQWVGKIPTSIPNFNIHSGTTLFHGRIYMQQKLQTEYDEESEGHCLKDLQ